MLIEARVPISNYGTVPSPTPIIANLPWWFNQEGHQRTNSSSATQSIELYKRIIRDGDPHNIFGGVSKINPSPGYKPAPQETNHSDTITAALISATIISLLTSVGLFRSSNKKDEIIRQQKQKIQHGEEEIARMYKAANKKAGDMASFMLGYNNRLNNLKKSLEEKEIESKLLEDQIKSLNQVIANLKKSNQSGGQQTKDKTTGHQPDTKPTSMDDLINFSSKPKLHTPQDNYFTIFPQINKNMTPYEIKVKLKSLIPFTHPDQQPYPQLNQISIIIGHALDQLGDPSKLREYLKQISK